MDIHCKVGFNATCYTDSFRFLDCCYIFDRILIKREHCKSYHKVLINDQRFRGDYLQTVLAGCVVVEM